MAETNHRTRELERFIVVSVGGFALVMSLVGLEIRVPEVPPIWQRLWCQLRS
jgi:hypothetical protein